MDKDSSRDWHYRLWCPCGEYNYQNEYGAGRSPNIHICPECGRPSNRFWNSKGRWNRDWEKGNPWGRNDWETWLDPDSSGITESMNFFQRLVQRFKPIRKDIMSSPVFVEPEEEEEPEKKAITRRKKRVRKKVTKKRKKSSNGRKKKVQKK